MRDIYRPTDRLLYTRETVLSAENERGAVDAKTIKSIKTRNADSPPAIPARVAFFSAVPRENHAQYTIFTPEGPLAERVIDHFTHANIIIHGRM